MLASAAAFAGAATVDLPSGTIVEAPDPGLSKAMAAYSGVWDGAIGTHVTVVLAVVKERADGADIVFANSDWAGWHVMPNQGKAKATATDDGLAFNFEVHAVAPLHIAPFAMVANALPDGTLQVKSKTAYGTFTDIFTRRIDGSSPGRSPSV